GSSSGGRLSLVKGAAGKALHIECVSQWSGTVLPIKVRDSQGLKMAFHMKGINHRAATVNVFDSVRKDNTTAYGYRHLHRSGAWTPVLYHVSRFHYNSSQRGYINRQATFTGIRFFGPAKLEANTSFTLDNFVLYRGDDRQAPVQVTGLKVTPTGKGMHLTWMPGDDNVAVQVYGISRARDGGPFMKIAESIRTEFIDASAGKGKCAYRVLAVDFEENMGPWSAPVAAISAGRSHSTQMETAYFADHIREVHRRGKGKVRKGHATLFGDSLTGATSYHHQGRAALRTMTVNAFGYAGMRTSFGRNRVAQIIRNENPEFIFILYGTNNSKSPQSIKAAMEDMESIMKTCEENGTVAIVGTIPPRGFKDPKSTGEANYNAALKDLARKLKIPVGYIFEEIQALGFEKRNTCIAADGVHWHRNGFFVAAQSWGKALDEVRFVLRDLSP
ncbi:MAG: SGNH/GDSL hydrolase family protein, partial [Planctomycetota bacterium]|nr:SGNH/GDSL hydrolase family protein [Planctomycetota bacterium]